MHACSHDQRLAYVLVYARRTCNRLNIGCVYLKVYSRVRYLVRPPACAPVLQSCSIVFSPQPLVPPLPWTRSADFRPPLLCFPRSTQFTFRSHAMHAVAKKLVDRVVGCYRTQKTASRARKLGHLFVLNVSYSLYTGKQQE